MANIAELQASIKIKADQAIRDIKDLNDKINKLNNSVKENEKLTKEENKQLKEYEKGLKASEKELSKLTKAQNDLNNGKQKSTGIWSKLTTQMTIAGLAVNAIVGAFNKLKQVLTEAGREALQFQKNMSLVNTVFQVSKQDINNYSKEVASLAKKLGKAPSEMAMGLYEIAQAGVNSADSMKVLELATKASVAGFTDVQTAVKAGIGMMNAYGMSTEDLSKIYDVQFKIVERGILSYEDLKEAFGNVLANAVQAKVPMEEMGGQLAFLTKQGQNSAKASIALARAYEGIFNNADKFEKLGISVSDSNGKLRSTTDILGDLAKKIKNLSEKTQFDILDQLGFSARADRAIIAMMENVEGVRKEITNVSNNVGVMDKAFGKAQDNILTDWNKLKSGVFEKVADWIIDNEKGILGLISALGGLIEGFGILAKSIGTGLDLFTQMITLGTSESFNEFVGKLKDIGNNYREAQKEAEKLRKTNNEMQEENRKWAEENLDQSDLMKVAIEKQNKYYEALGKGLIASQNAYQSYGTNVTSIFEKIVTNSGKMAKSVGTNLLEAMTILSDIMPEGYIENFAQSMAKGAGEAYKRNNPKATSKQVGDITKEEYDYWKDFLSMTKKDREKIVKDLGKNMPTFEKIALENIELENDPFGKEKDKAKKLYNFRDEQRLFFKNLKEQGKSVISDEGREDYINFLMKSIEEMNKDNLDTSNVTKLLKKANKEYLDILIERSDSLDQEKSEKEIQELNKKISEQYNYIFTEEKKYVLTMKMLGKNTDTVEYRKAMNDLYDKQIQEIILLYGDTQEAKDKIKSIQDKKFSVEKTVSLDEKLTATSSLISELGNALENDLIGALGNTINSISSIVRMGSQMKAFGGEGSNLLGGLGIATAVIGIVGSIAQELKWTENVSSTAQDEANNKFVEAVDKFEESVNNMNIGQKINFAKLYRPNINTGDITAENKAIVDNSGNEIMWGANNATFDATGLKNKLKGGDYSNINVDAIMAKYAQRQDFINSANWFQKESRIVGYDIAGATAEINKLIAEAYKKNQEAFKEAVGISSEAFSSGLMEALETGDIEPILEKMFTDALKKSFINQEAFSVAFKVLGNKQMESILSVMGLKAKSEDELSKMSAEEITAYIKEMMKGFPEIMKQFGLGVENASTSLNKFTDSVKTNDLPSVIKLISLENQSTKGYNSGTNYYIQSVYGSVDGQFRNMVNKSVANDTTKRTGN